MGCDTNGHESARIYTNVDKLFVLIRNTIRSFLCVATRFSSCGNLTADFTHEERDFFAATSLRHSDFGYSDFGFWLRPWPRWVYSWFPSFFGSRARPL